MTIAIGINLNLYAILAADTRVTYKPVSGEPFYDDNSSKVQKTKMGLITGAGFCPLLDAIKGRLASEEITNTNQTLNVIMEETEKISIVWRNYPELKSAIEKTGWIFSYITALKDQSLLRVAIFHPNVNKQAFGIYEIGQPAIIFPEELKSDTAQTLYEMILREVKIPSNSSEIQSSIEHNSSIIALLIGSLQPCCPSISGRFQVGLHWGSQMGISDITDIRNDGKFKLNIKFES